MVGRCGNMALSSFGVLYFEGLRERQLEKRNGNQSLPGPGQAGYPVFQLEVPERTRVGSRERGSRSVRYLKLGRPPIRRKKPEGVDDDLEQGRLLF
jgi:hypothetical protein